MRVLVVSHMYPSKREPTAGVFIHQQVAALRAAGAEVVVVAPQPWAPALLALHPRWRRYGEVFRQGALPDAPCERLAYPRVPGAAGNVLAGFAIAAALLPRLARLRRRFPFDVIHAHTVTPDGLAALVVGRVLRVPVVCTARGSELHTAPRESRARRLVTRRVLEGVAAMLAVSGALAGLVGPLTDGRASARVIYNGVDTARFCPVADRGAVRRALGLPEQGVLALFVGRVEREKGAVELFGAFRRAAEAVPQLRLVVVGDGPVLAGATRELAAAGLSDRLIALGHRPHDEIPGLMQAADLLVLPSWAEGMPNVVLEALATGLTPLVTPAGGVTEIIDDGRNGLVVPLRDEAALAQALVRLASDAPLRRRLGAAALATARERLSWARNAARHLEIYREVTDR